jgi:6-phosphogluconolactonase (cycloisomerase 2 family)
MTEAPPILIFCVGTYTERHPSHGPALRGAAAHRLGKRRTNPSFLAIHPNRRVLYAVNELDAGVSAF